MARAIELQFQHDAEVTLWTEGIFGLGEPTIESLLNALDRFDFAILVLSPDDLKVSRNQEHMGPRDNVLFELGLFMGRLGKKRTFVVCSGNPQVRLPRISLELPSRHTMVSVPIETSLQRLARLVRPFAILSATWGRTKVRHSVDYKR